MTLIICMHVLVGALLLAIPNMSRRTLLFAVPVPQNFRQGPTGRHAIAMFRLVVAVAVLAGIGVFFLSPARLMNAVLPAVNVGTVICALLAFYWQYRALTPFAVEVAGQREAAITTVPERLPWFVWLGAGPFAMIGAAALYLYLNWDRIPARFPVHWGFEGPDRWANRTVKGVYGTLLFAAELSVYLLIMALASWYGARRSRSRQVMLGAIVAINNVVGCMFALIAVDPVLHIPFWAMMLGIMGAIIAIAIVVVSKMNEPGEGPDPTPQECWKAGIIYYNPNDAVLFVEKREGVGYTFNFANGWSWVLMAGLLLVLASAAFII
jgi:uncharacterized membrane protein